MRIFFSAGEPSGDQHAAHLIQELKSRNPDVQAEGFGGPEMQRQGCQLLFELTQLAVMGFLRVVPMLAKFRRLVIAAEKHFDASPPDAVVLVDFPGFNWWIARAAKKRGIPVYYYLPPQLWAWAPWRIRRVRKWIDKVICTLPFEYEWYHRRGVSTVWVGHPFFDEVAAKQLDVNLITELQNTATGPVIGVLPGSRDHEVRRNFPVMLRTIERVAAAVPDARWIVGNYREQHTDMCRELHAESEIDADLTYFVDRTSEVIEAADCCLMVSGSISLELLARRTPGVIVYRAPWIGKQVARVMMNCRFITLTNLMADKELMPEFVSAGNPENDIQAMSQHLISYCQDPAVFERVQSEISELANRATITGATIRTAELLLAELNQSGEGSTTTSCAA